LREVLGVEVATLLLITTPGSVGVGADTFGLLRVRGTDAWFLVLGDEENLTT
jgi:hypothetical protein